MALANASLLGVGYVLLRRGGLAVLDWIVTLLLLAMLGTGHRTVTFEFVVVAWWALTVMHGWFLAGGRMNPFRGFLGGWRSRRVLAQRVIALSVATPVLLAVPLLRADASSTEKAVDHARRSGDCAAAVKAQQRVWIGTRLADSPLTKRGESTVTACRRLTVAKADLKKGLTGDTRSLKAGFDGLASVLADQPGHQAMVDSALDGFLGSLPTKDACRTVTITDWLRTRKTDGSTLDRATASVSETAPGALIGCARSLMAEQSWAKAKARYQQVVDQYPHSTTASAAKAGVKKAQLTIERNHVIDLLTVTSDAQPQYCNAPARYPGAPALRKGLNKALFFGDSTYTDDMPGSWTASSIADTTLVVCVGDDEEGPSVQTCSYRTGSGQEERITFHKIALPVKVYQLGTGKLVARRTLKIGGKSCPAYLSYEYSTFDNGPDTDQLVDPSTADVRAAFRPLVNR